jgi:dTDP-4-amino-4,6-dideoxygalactose transaminase
MGSTEESWVTPRPVGVGTWSATPRTYELINGVLESGCISYGPMSQEFEHQFSEIHGTRYAVLSNSGTSALQIALCALKEIHGWDHGDSVIVPATTFVATANIVKHCRLNPTFVDVDPVTYNIDPGLIEPRITGKTRAIIPVHLFGQPADMTAIRAIAKRYDLKIIEDSCETMFARHAGKRVGSWGDIGCFSTYVAHLIVTGVGGISLTDNPDYAAKMRSLVNHGLQIDHLNPDENFAPRPTPGRRFKFDTCGFSYRITELEAALGLAQLEDWERMVKIRQRNAKHLTAGIRNLINRHYGDPIKIPETAPGNDHVWMMYPILLRTGSKEPLMTFLNEHGVETRDMLPILEQPIYSYLNPSQFPISKWILEAGFYVGCHQDIPPDDIQYIIHVLEQYYTLPHENTEFWIDKAEDIKRHILKEDDDPEVFLTWPSVTSTMFVGNAPYITQELDYLRSNGWQRWKDAILDPAFGNPVESDLVPFSSGNYIHQAYHLAQFESATGRKIDSFGKIIEIGAGYGSMAVIARQSGFNGHYVLYDQPIVSYLQRYYLSNTLESDRNLHFCDDLEKLDRFIEGTDLLIACYSLSELTIKHRDLLAEKLKDIPYILIVHQHTHEGVDNIRWFDELMKVWSRHHWQIREAAVTKMHRYLIGDTQMRGYKQIFTTGYPRSGNTWLDRLLSDLLDAPLQTNPGEVVQTWGVHNNKPIVVRKRHTIHRQPGPTVFIYRDPRDVAVSAMHYRINTNLADVLKGMIGTGIKTDDLGVQQGNYEGWIRSWWGKDRAQAIVSYEQLHKNPVKHLKRIVKELVGIDLKTDHVVNVIERQEFQNVLKNNPEYYHSMRKGVAGDWVNYFTRDLGRLLHERLGELMREQGYIKSDDWWEELPTEPVIHYENPKDADESTSGS